jgi:sterol desaturase/sphingolipid hydroxylase (fatty acid hydroxylase superfamily)
MRRATPMADAQSMTETTTPHLLGMPVSVALVVVAATAIAIEFTILRARRDSVDFADAGRSISMGLLWAGARMVGGKALMFGAWVWLWHHVALRQLPMSNPLTWLAYWLIGDFLYYWTHRSEHRIRLLWSSHLVHHSSEQFNLATAVRQPWTEVFYKPLIAMWAPLLGFNPVMYVTVGAISLLAGQWQHLEWFPRLRALDALIMSPSNHRVHHGRNARYIDRNFGGSLVLWDKLFGTYEPEGEVPVYGVIHLPPAATVLGSSLGGYPELWKDMRAAESARSAVAIAAGRP